TSDEFNGVTRDGNGVVRPLVTRHFDGFRAAAEENGRSRIYLGIHWDFDNQMGQMEGRGVATDVFHRLATPVMSLNQQFVIDVYRDLLQRRPDPTGLSAW